MKKLNIFLATCLCALSSFALADRHPTSSVVTVVNALDKLGFSAEQFEDIEGEPHLVLSSRVDGVEDVAVYFDDCDSRGYCEDVTYYANYGKNDVSLERLNAWNHIGSKNRSKAFKSSDGSVGLSLTVSMLPAKDFVANGSLAGQFLLESETFGVMLELSN